MPLDLTGVFGNINNIKSNLFYGEDITETTIKFLNVSDVLLEVTENWYMKKNPTSNLAIGEEYWEASISDPDIDLSDILPLTTAVVVGTERYKITQYFRPRGATKKWKLRLESIGEHE